MREENEELEYKDGQLIRRVDSFNTGPREIIY